ncbi:MAG: hypothetical protein FJ128_14810 [Deltaproteobacteria bacterium]|nr:hypothetical protein [Deltaproteobacteria bacterium]
MIESLESGARLLLGIGAVFFTGLGPLALVSPSRGARPRGELLALSFGLGALFITLWMLALTALERPFTLVGATLPPVLGSAAALGVSLWGRRGPASAPPRQAEALAGLDWLGLGLLGLILLFACLRAVIYPVWAWDALATWGFKAKVFFHRQSIDLAGFEAHNYYPNLVPLLLTYLYLWLGQVNDHLVKAVFPLWGALLLLLLHHLGLRMGLSRRQALFLTAFFAANGTVFIEHLFIAYADLPLAYYTLGGAGLVFLWLAGAAPPGSMPLAALMLAGMSWCKYEGPPLAGTILLAGFLTLLRLRPPGLLRRLGALAGLAGGIALGLWPWRLFLAGRGIQVGIDHVFAFYPSQLWQALPMVLATLLNPKDFGILWPVWVIALAVGGRSLWHSPRLFLILFVGGNLAAILLAYALAPTSAAEFPLYVRATIDRLLLHLTPVAALLAAQVLNPLNSPPDPAG